jgi:hypothetical protein
VNSVPAVRIAGSADIEVSGGGGTTSDVGRLPVALTVVPLYVDARVVASPGVRVKRPTRQGDEGRERPRELVRREKALRQFVAEFEASR